MARKSKYDETMPPRAKLLAKRGFKQKQIAAILGISESTFYEWIKKFPELSESIKKGKNKADADVIASLYKKCLGYEVDEITKEIPRGMSLDLRTGEIGDYAEELKITKIITKHIQADITSIIFWLSNRDNSDWKKNPDLHGSNGHSWIDHIVIKGMPENAV